MEDDELSDADLYRSWPEPPAWHGKGLVAAVGTGKNAAVPALSLSLSSVSSPPPPQQQQHIGYQLRHQHEQPPRAGAVQLGSGGSTKVRMHRGGSVDIDFQEDAGARRQLWPAARGVAKSRQPASVSLASSAPLVPSATASAAARHTGIPPRLPGSPRSAASGSLSFLAQHAPGKSAAVVAAMSALQDKVRAAERELEASETELAAARSDADQLRRGEARLQQRAAAKEREAHDAREEARAAREEAARAQGALGAARSEVAALAAALDKALAAHALEAGRRAEEAAGAAHRAERLEARAAEDRAQHVRAQGTAARALADKEAEVQELHASLKAELAHRAQTDAQRAEADELLQGLIALNQSLVEKVAAYAHQVPRQQARQTEGRGLLHTERRARAKTTDKAAARQHTHPRQHQHKNEPKHPRNRKHQHEPKHDSLDKQLLRANLGKPVPFVLGGSAGESFSVYSKVQHGLSNADAFGNKPRAGEREQGEPQGTASPRSAALAQSPLFAPDTAQADMPALEVQHRDAALRSSSSASESARSADSEAAQVMATLRHELEDLRAQYQAALAGVSARDISHGVSADKPLELMALVDKIEGKGQQLFLLDRYRQAMLDSRSRSPVRSPKAFDKKVHALRALQALREAELS
jgi:hypothetical protein